MQSTWWWLANSRSFLPITLPSRPPTLASISSEDEDAHAIALRENALEREHDAREFAAGAGFAKRLNELAGIGLDHELDLVDAGCGRLGRRHEVDREFRFLHPEFRQRFFDLRESFFATTFRFSLILRPRSETWAWSGFILIAVS